MNKIIAVGDIHGSYDKLRKMLARLKWPPGSGETLVFLGDYIDRGPAGYEVVECLSKLSAASPRVICLMGNHERIFLDFLSGQSVPALHANGIAATVRAYSGDGREMNAAHLNFLRGLPLFYETDDYIFVHAGMLPGLPLEKQSPQDLLWIRDKFLESDYDFGKTVVFGHTPFKEPFAAPGRLGLDTGAVYGGPLTAIILPEERFVYID